MLVDKKKVELSCDKKMSNYAENVDDDDSSISENEDLCYLENSLLKKANKALAQFAGAAGGAPTEEVFGDMPTVEDVREEDFFHTSTHFFNCA